MKTSDVAPVTELRDFPDVLPAVLVKELRQGLRGRMFVAPFLVLQALLIISCLQGTPGASQFFWNCLAIMLVCLLPARNLGALGEERQANTLDTLILTRLTPWRIVWGKWCATAAQSAITAVAAMPCLLVRYLNDGANFAHEGALLLILLLLSGAIAGVFTAFSTVASPLTRNGLAAALLIVTYGAIALPAIRGFSIGPPPALAPVGAVAVTAIWAAPFSLWHAAASIAPASANLTTPRRLTSLAALLLIGTIGIVPATPDFQVVACGLGILVFSCAVEMGERTPEHPVGTRRGWRGLAAAVFHPGWPSGVVFCLILWGFAIALSAGRLDPPFLQVAALCFFPVTARCLFPARFRNGAALMLLLGIASIIVFRLCRELLPDESAVYLSLLPSLQRDPPAGISPVVPALFWAAAALVLAVRPLVRLLRSLHTGAGER